MDGLSRQRLPQDRKAVTRHFVIGKRDLYATVGMYDDGRPGELFIRMAGESGSMVAVLLDGVGIQTSLSWQYGSPLHTTLSHWRGTHDELGGFTGEGEAGIKSASSVLDFLAQWMAARWPEQSAAVSIAPQEEGKPNG